MNKMLEEWNNDISGFKGLRVAKPVRSYELKIEMLIGIVRSLPAAIKYRRDNKRPYFVMEWWNNRMMERWNIGKMIGVM
jgi:hypothetical protein